ncbi:MAG TPA: YtxH domain-containing protein [Verrucomicrobiae bacterium]|nr:YtxH domain-containing protein [Verrucomicrobiae bacterium]
MSDNSESNRIAGYLAAFAIGALIGTGVALLYAPRSGKETRELLAKKSRELKGKASDVLDDAKDFVHGKKAELAAAVEAGKEAMREERAKHQKAA